MRPPALLPDTDRRFVTRVPAQPYLRFDRNDYSLDPRLVGRRVEVRATEAQIAAICLDSVSSPTATRASSPADWRSPTPPSSRRSSAARRAPAPALRARRRAPPARPLRDKD